MIDIHNHIIFDVDDGSKSLEQSVRMIRAAKEAGINKICFTPHYMEDGYRTEKDVLKQKVSIIKDAIKENHIDMELYLGEEVFIFPDMADSLDKLVCINDSKYILMEFPLIEEVSYIDDVIYKLLSYGKIPIIAHPERYLASEKDFTFVENLIQKGALLQINANSLVERYGKPAKQIAVKILKNNMAQFVGSDAHSSASYRCIIESLNILKKLVGEEKFKELTEINPEKVLNNMEIEVDTSSIGGAYQENNKWFMNLLKRKVG